MWTARPSGSAEGARLDPLGDPLYGISQALRTGAILVADKQKQRLWAALNDDKHVEVEATRLIYQRIVAANRQSDRAAAKTTLTEIIGERRAGVPKPLR